MDPFQKKTFEIRVRTGKKNAFNGFDKDIEAFRVDIKAPPEKGKANAEIIRFLGKTLGRQVRIKSGLTSKRKVIEFID